MFSLPPVGGTTCRSLFAVWAAAIVPLVNRRFAAPTRFASTNPVFTTIVRRRRQSRSPFANRQPAGQTASIEFGNCASAAARLQAEA
jgi:hypothetical protein